MQHKRSQKSDIIRYLLMVKTGRGKENKHIHT